MIIILSMNPGTSIKENCLSLEQTLTSGQCFRVSCKNKSWTVRSGVDESVRELSVSQDNLTPIEQDPYWSNFFDLQTDYQAMKNYFSDNWETMKTACLYAPGIRILRQDRWEALACFVVSQNNNIKRIMGIVERLCACFGKRNADGVHGFPCARTLADAPLDKLRDCGLGFRDSYIRNTATAVLEGNIDFEFLSTAPIEEARKMLTRTKGIGPKVADCALLFGCHRLDCFPVDVWMKRVMETYFDGQDGTIFGENAGVAQQYLFHWGRTSGILSGTNDKNRGEK